MLCLIVYAFPLKSPDSEYYDYAKLAAFINKKQVAYCLWI